jgi:hypothetical protein
MMHEYIFAAVGRGDETEALRVVKPLHCSCSHCTYLMLVELRCFAVRFLEREYGSDLQNQQEDFRTNYKNWTATALTIHKAFK